MRWLATRLVPMAFAGAVLLGSAAADTVKAVPADSFVEFIGVQGHLDREDAVWRASATAWKLRLQELGIRYMRTAIRTSLSARNKARAIYQDYGVRLNVLINPLNADGILKPAQIAPQLSFLKNQVGMEKIASVEGPNEYSSTEYEGNVDWPAELRSFQTQLHQQMKADSRSRDVPVLAPTIWRRILEDYQQLGSLGSAADNGTLHYYNGGRKPSRYKLERFFGDDVGVESPMDLAIDNAQITRPDRPVYVTETGFNMRDADQTETQISERTAAKYVPRLLAELFLRSADVRKAYLFSLVDNTPDRLFGLVRRDMTRKPAFYAVKNAIRLLSDKGASFVPGSLTYTLTGDLALVRHVVLQKRNGTFYLVIWNDALSWDRTTFSELNPPPANVTLDIRQHAFATLRTYRPSALDLADPNQGILPVRTINAPRSVRLKVPDHIVVVEMVP